MSRLLLVIADSLWVITTEADDLRTELQVRTAGVDSKAQTLPGLAFPVDQEVVQCLEQLRDGVHNYLQLVRPHYHAGSNFSQALAVRGNPGKV